MEKRIEQESKNLKGIQRKHKMPFFPTHAFSYHTAMTVDEAIERLKEKVEPSNTIRAPWSNQKPYEGTVSQNGFAIRSIVYTNHAGVHPVVKGNIRSTDDGARVTITFTLRHFGKAFLAIWSGITGFAGLIFLIPALADMSPDKFLGFLICAAVFTLAHVLVRDEFDKELERTKQFLAGLHRHSPDNRPT